jgi:DNA-binding transcriptional regulator YiaG
MNDETSHWRRASMKNQKNGWVEGSAKEFLELTDADVEYIETRRALSRRLKKMREKLQLTQVEVAARLHTSQSRVAKMEKADPTVSADLLLQALFRLGLKRKQLIRL